MSKKPEQQVNENKSCNYLKHASSGITGRGAKLWGCVSFKVVKLQNINTGSYWV